MFFCNGKRKKSLFLPSFHYSFHDIKRKRNSLSLPLYTSVVQVFRVHDIFFHIE